VRRWFFEPAPVVSNAPIDVLIPNVFTVLGLPQAGDGSTFYVFGDLGGEVDLSTATATTGSAFSHPAGLPCFRPTGAAFTVTGNNHANTVSLADLSGTDTTSVYGAMINGCKEPYGGANYWFRNDGGATSDGRIGIRNAAGAIAFVDVDYYGRPASRMVATPTGVFYVGADGIYVTTGGAPARVVASTYGIDFTATTSIWGCYCSANNCIYWCIATQNNIYKFNISTHELTTITPSAGYTANRVRGIVSDGVSIFFTVSATSYPYSPTLFKMNISDAVVSSVSAASANLTGGSVGDLVVSPVDGLVYVLIGDNFNSVVKSLVPP
jgi:hypothetical protein